MTEKENAAQVERGGTKSITFTRISLTPSENKSQWDYIQEFRSAIDNAGVDCRDPIIVDGKIHRFKPGGKGNPNGWYVCHGKAGSFGDWKKGTKETWSTKNPSLTFEEREKLVEDIKKSQESAQEETRIRNQEAAEKALRDWESFSEAGQSPYLTNKKADAIGIRFGDGFIAVPLKDAEGKLWSYQKIFSDGDKKLLTGGRKKGCFHTLGQLENGGPIYVVEGYATGSSVYMATNIPTVFAIDAGNIDSVIWALKKKYPNSPITIAADDDWHQEPNPGKIKAAEASKKYGCQVIFPLFKNREEYEKKPTDWNDLHVLEGLSEVKNQFRKFCGEENFHKEDEEWLQVYDVKELLELEIPPREMILEPIIPKQGLGMLYAQRGVGKTHVALSIAYAVACGGDVFDGKWKCEKENKVLFVDGEMPAPVIRERLNHLIAGTEYELQSQKNLRIITPDLQKNGIPDLSTVKGQKCIEKYLEDIDLLILDNLSSLCRSGKENESESWMPVQEWLLKLRRLGKSVLIVHHSGKSGNQRGTSKKEDLLDTIISLRRPEDYEASQGARFEVHYEKARGFYGDEAKPFEAQLTQEGEKTSWQVQDLEDCQYLKILQLKEEGLNQRQIAKEMGLGLGTINRNIKKARAEGRIL